MGFTCGLIGLPNAGKSTIFNALSGAGARVEPYPFCTIDANIGTVPVPDPRLDRLAALFPDKKRVPTHLEFIDIAGLVPGASEGEGMGNQFLSEIRAVDAILHVVRCFADANVAHVAGEIDPVRDIEAVETELLLKDLETMTRVRERLVREAKGPDRRAPARLAAWTELVNAVAAGVPLRDQEIPPVVADLVHEVAPLTVKPVIYVANVGENDDNPYAAKVAAYATAHGTEAIAISGWIEAEVAGAAESPAERIELLAEWGRTETGLSRLIQAGYRALDLITFFTFVGPEVHAWTVRRGTTAPQAGGTIHSDFATRFVLAEVMDLDELIAAGSERALRDTGRVTRAGRDYIVQDGDVIHFISA